MDLMLNTSQKMLMSQKMLQSTEILQMSSSELLDYVKEISVENPVVDYEEKTDEQEKFDRLRKKLDYLDASDEQNRTYYAEDKDDENENDDWKFKGSPSQSLESCLLEQINVLKCKPCVKKIGTYIIGCLDQNGYLKETPEEIAEVFGIRKEYVIQALDLVKSFEPAGVAAKDLKECLLIQLKRNNISNPLAEKIINGCLEMVGKNQIHLISKKLKACQEDVSEAISLIKKLNPKPGNSFDSGKSLEYITPDAIIVKGKDGYEIILNDRFFPNIGINTYYRSMLDKNSDGETKEYVLNKIKQAEWVITCINKRNSTLMKTLKCIVDIQKDFFDYGAGYIKPMCLNDVAKVIEMHESTVSRTIKQKYIQCCHGVFPLSYFFQSSISSDSGEKVTPEKIKLLIKEIVENEDPSSPLSDRAITEILNGKGIEISRRTVAKYRGMLGMHGTSGRKC